MRIVRTLQCLLLAGSAALTSCNTVGPTAVAGARSAYTDALAQTEAEQMLQNLVRLRYIDLPLFLQVTSVNTQYELRTGADASIDGVFDGRLSDYSGRLGAGVAITERPTVTYAPLQGDEFVKRVMSPIGLENLALMVRSGWRVEHVLAVCCQSLAHAKNAPRATGPAHDADTDNTEFTRVVGLIGEASRSDGGRLMGDAQSGYRYILDVQNPAVLAWLDAIQVTPRPEIPVVHGFTLDRDAISIQTRSLIGAMFYLSLGTEVPQEHIDSGIAPVPPHADYQDITKGIFVLHSSTTEPSRAFIRTRYRGYWFYIDDTDHASKATFALLTLLFSLQSGSRQALQPAVTIPLN